MYHRDKKIIELGKPFSKVRSNIRLDPSAVIAAAAESMLIAAPDFDASGLSNVYANLAFKKRTDWSKADVSGKYLGYPQAQGPTLGFSLI
jgi:hypothetical protein